MEVSDFSLASMGALAIFLAVMIPWSLWQLVRAVVLAIRREGPPVDPWLAAIGLSILVCVGLAVYVAAYSDRADRLLNASAMATFALLLFAVPAVLQVLRAWSSERAHKPVLNHALVLLAVLSLPASMAIPTAALMRAAEAASPHTAAPADNPAAALVDDRFFTDNEVANDPVDYPAAQFLERYASVQLPPAANRTGQRPGLIRQIPMFTAFWIDQTTNMLTFDATDTFGILVSHITHVRANLALSLAVWIYKLLCALVLVIVTFDVLLRPIGERIRGRGAAKA